MTIKQSMPRLVNNIKSYLFNAISCHDIIDITKPQVPCKYLPLCNEIRDMESVKSGSTSRYPTFMYFVLIGVVSETLFLHYKTTSQNDKLKQKIDEIEIKQGLTAKELSHVRHWTTGKEHVYMQNFRNMEKKVQLRVKRHVEEKSQALERALNALRILSHLMNNASMAKKKCSNVTLVCQKGERGPRGKAGPRGLKGDMGAKGAKGEKGVAGQIGQRGLTGKNGQKGQKGDPGPPGKSIEKPKVVTKLQKVITRPESSNISLFCEAEGNPKPSISWRFGSQKIDSRYSYPVNGALSISNISKKDEGNIKCIAENILGEEVLETRLTVHTKPKVILQSRKLIATEGTSFQVNCSAEGSPYPKLEWKKGFGKLSGQQILSKDSKTLSLKFDKPDLSDAGWYVCEAENYLGRSEKSMSLDITARDCSGFIGTGKSGVYTINPDGHKSFSAFCDMKTNGGGWTVIQRRADGSVDFFKNWVDYKLGFGAIENEFWLGNEKIHRLTKRKNMMIRFDLEDVDGNKAFAEYKMFYIDGESENYRAHVSGYSGTAGDSFSRPNGKQFSTKDRDHDTSSDNCASVYHGAWWYDACHSSNLNGKYLNGPHKSYANGINWYSFKGYHNSLKMTEMKVRPVK